MKDRILGMLGELRDYARQQGHTAAFFYHEEDSKLLRFANSAISLNTNEHLIRLTITAYSGYKRASYHLIADPDDRDQMKRGIDAAAEMVEHSQPLTYRPTIPVLDETFVDESAYDAALAQMDSRDRLDYVNSAVQDLETQDLRLSGIFSSGSNTTATTNTESDHTLYFTTSDAQVTVVLAHQQLKWEVIAEQSAQKRSELHPDALRRELAFLVGHYHKDPPRQLPLGAYNIVFGPAATAELISMMNWIGFDGGLMKRGYSFLGKDDVDRQVFSDKFTLIDDPRCLETFPFARDFTGIPRAPFPLFEKGVFQGFVWAQDDADEFDAAPTGHTVAHKSLVLEGGEKQIDSLESLVNLARDKDILYIPFLHYMNVVNPSRGMITGSSRFGALILRENGGVEVPFNVRLTLSLLDIFGQRMDWLSKTTIPYNTSQSYGARNPTAVIVPRFIKVNDLDISHSNPSY